jgi:hypothetical protein
MKNEWKIKNKEDKKSHLGGHGDISLLILCSVFQSSYLLTNNINLIKNKR